MGLPFIVAAEHPRESREQRALARPGRAEQQHALARFDAQREIPHGPRSPAAVPPAPAFARDRRGTNIHARDAQALADAGRPAANRLSAPVFASARTISHEPRPAKTIPEIVVEIV